MNGIVLPSDLTEPVEALHLYTAEFKMAFSKSEAAYGVVLTTETGEEITSAAKFIQASDLYPGQTEYKAVILGLEIAYTLGASSVAVHSKSAVVVDHVNGARTVKGPVYQALIQRVDYLMTRVSSVTVERVIDSKNPALVLAKAEFSEAKAAHGGTKKKRAKRLATSTTDVRSTPDRRSVESTARLALRKGFAGLSVTETVDLLVQEATNELSILWGSAEPDVIIKSIEENLSFWSRTFPSQSPLLAGAKGQPND